MSKNLTHERSDSKDVGPRVVRLQTGANYVQLRTQRKMRFCVVFRTKGCRLQLARRVRMLAESVILLLSMIQVMAKAASDMCRCVIESGSVEQKKIEPLFDVNGQFHVRLDMMNDVCRRGRRNWRTEQKQR